MSENRKVRLVMMQGVYKKHPWPIPIVQDGGRYLTGQKLTYKQMTGEAELSVSERAQYPVVINPHNLYKGVDRKYYYLNDDNDKAMYDLMLLSGKIASSETEYKRNKEKYLGFFRDDEVEAREGNAFKDLQFEAESRVRKMPLAEYDKILLALNYKVASFHFEGSMLTISPDRKKHEILKACEEYPEAVLDCFADRNPGIDEELFIIELINLGILTQKQDGAIMHGQSYIADNIDGVKRYLAKEENIYLRKKWQVTLDERKGYLPKGASNNTIEGPRKPSKPWEEMTYEELVKYVSFGGNRVKKKDYLDLIEAEDREGIIAKLNAEYSNTTA